MKFIFLGGQFTTYMGRMFAFKKATEVTDRATIAALLKNPEFMRVDDDPVAPPPAPVVKRPTLTVGRRR